MIKTCLRIFLVAFFLLAVPSVSLAMVGDIVEYAGEVFVLQDDTWSPVNITPFSVVAGNRIMVREGRATLTLEGWGRVVINRHSLMDVMAELDQEGVPKEGTSNLTLLLSLGQVKMISSEGAVNAPVLKSPTATVYPRGGSALVSVGIDGMSEMSLAGGASANGRYGKYKSDDFPINPTEDKLTYKTLFEVFDLIGKKERAENFSVTDALVLSKKVIMTAWPSLSESSLNPELAKMQLEEATKEAAASLIYINSILDRQGPFLVKRMGSSLIDAPEMIISETGVQRDYGTSNYYGMPLKSPSSLVIRMRAGLEISVRQDDKVYDRLSGLRVEDTITTASPWLLVGLYERGGQMELAYRADAHTFGDLEAENYRTHTAWLGVSYGGDEGGGFFTLSDKNVTTKDYREERLLKALHTTNLVRMRTGIAPGRVMPGIYLGAEHFSLTYDYVNLEPLNRTRGEVYAGIDYNVMPNTAMFVEAAYGLSDYTDSPNEDLDSDASILRGAFGFRWHSQGKAKGHFKVGAIKMEYDDILDAMGGKHRSDNEAYMDMDIDYTMSANERLKMDGFLSMEPSTYAGGGIMSPSTHYIRSGGGITYQGRYSSGLGLKLGTGFEKHEHARNVKGLMIRLDDISWSNIELLYYYQSWIRVSVGYETYEVASNDDSRDEKHRMTTFGIKTEF